MLSTLQIKHTVLLARHYSAAFVPETIFNEENIKKTIAKFVAAPPIRLQTIEPAKKAAVLIPICLVDDKVSLLYTLRAANLKVHRGQVSFPGGMQDVKDKSLVGTALRETKEELGISERDVVVWGNGNMIVSKSDTCILPVVGKHFFSLLLITYLNTGTDLKGSTYRIKRFVLRYIFRIEFFFYFAP